jgi:hypothetical protein
MEQTLNGLIVDEPWISLILSGRKTWEMRSQATQIRGRIALIKKGSGCIVGLADLVDVIGPLDSIARHAHRDKHCIPRDLDETSAHWDTAWVLEGAKPLAQAVHYEHPPGAVIWVKLDDGISSSLLLPGTAAGLAHSSTVRPVSPLRPTPAGQPTLVASVTSPSSYPDPSEHVPFAKDGSWFGPHLARAGKYAIGAKGEEFSCQTFEAALDSLRRMPTARWRRPNSNGNWGIVSATHWGRPDFSGKN